ncbi:MAG TPA: hypothetical protein VLD62_02870 [Acidimicrobiia bacterium]|nr:hypothetical protein [Acidimicrobiia bacterium]
MAKYGPKSRRDAWFRVWSLFLLDLLFLVAGLLALRGLYAALVVVVAAGGLIAVAFNLVLLVRSRTSEATWAPAGGARTLGASLEYLGLSARAPVALWRVIGAVAIVVNLVALVVTV